MSAISLKARGGMSDGSESRGYKRYRRYEGKLHLVVSVVIAMSLILLFASTAFTWVSAVGTVLLVVGFALLLILIVGSDVWFPRLPEDVWQEASKDNLFETHINEMDEVFASLAKARVSAKQQNEAMRILIAEAIQLYRERYTTQLIRRGGRRLLILACIVLAFAGMARVLLLLDSSSYGEYMGLDSSFVDYVYFSFITVATIGYGDISPVTAAARVVSIAFGGVTIIYLLMIINYVWMHEARREGLLIEYLDRRYLAVPLAQ
jgi:prepilin signal peptidase PulO-like enzyme (type II secretory pathway)